MEDKPESQKEIESIGNKQHVSSKTNLIDWLVYFIITAILLYPFFTIDILKWISASLLLSFFAGMGNRIIRELNFIKVNLQNSDTNRDK